jgi:predicted peptidase
MRTFLIFSALVVGLASCKKEISPESSSLTANTIARQVIETQPNLIYPVIDSINSCVGGYYIFVPAHYWTSGQRYPLIFYTSGDGVYGNGTTDLPKVLNEGLPLLLKQKTFPPNFVVNSQNFSFIVAAPQFKRYPDNPNVIQGVINRVRKFFRIDTTRVYLTGISLGSIANGYLASASPREFAAFVPIAGINLSSNYVQSMVQAKLPVWAFSDSADWAIPSSYTIKFDSLYNSMHPAIPARLTLLPNYGWHNHDAWTKAMNPAYTENGMNIYQWMLQYQR